ncbi:hypothetical protein DIPPA_35080 [Diplonema papillatum]|nr:hypothetical protein DIPPA_35080 [Diplonema papillatum]|eukprot:gene9340-14479_t
MSVSALVLVQEGTGKPLWSARWDGRGADGWEQDVVADTRSSWPQQWKEGAFLIAGARQGGFIVCTSIDDVLLFAVADEDFGELPLQEYSEHIVHILSNMKKKEARLSRCILEEYPQYSVTLFDTVSPGGRVAYTVLADA